jgi:hypothetical protein
MTHRERLEWLETLRPDALASLGTVGQRPMSLLIVLNLSTEKRTGK